MNAYRIIKTISISIAISVLLNMIYLCAYNLYTGRIIPLDFNYYHEGIIELIMMSLAVIGIIIYLYMEGQRLQEGVLISTMVVTVERRKGFISKTSVIRLPKEANPRK